jgi:hypothetical protein
VPLEAGEPPIVPVSDKPTEPHEAVRWPEGVLAAARADGYGRLVVENGYRAAFCVGPVQVPRLLRLLDALATVLVERGHEVVAAKRFDRGAHPEFLVRTQGCMFALEVEERLASKPCELTAAEKKRRAASGHQDLPQYDYVPNGELRLKLVFTHHKYVGQKSWGDRQTKRLDDLLGRVVLAIEKAAHVERIEREESLRLEEEREVEERKRLRPERLRWYREWVTDDLDRMLDDWDRACRIREFLDEYNRRLPETARTPMVGRWVQVVQGLAEQLDPMNRVIEIAKELEPSDEVLARLVELEEPS